MTVRLPTTIGRELWRAVIGNADTENGFDFVSMQISARPLSIVDCRLSMADGPATEVLAVAGLQVSVPSSLWAFLVSVVLAHIRPLLTAK